MSTLPAGTPIEVWFQDEMRLGQKNPRTRRWARRGSRPAVPQDLRTESAYLFGAICPERGTGAAVVMPRADTEAILDAACQAWNAVLDTPWRIMSIGLRDWARTGHC